MAQEIANSTLLDTWGSSGAKIEPDISKIIEGWQLGEQPPHEYMNWLQNTFGSKLNHILKNGVPLWNNGTEYLAGATTQHNGSIWLCKTTNTNSEPTDSNSNWDKIPSLENLALTVDTVNDFPLGATTGDTCIVKDLDRGGIFIYDATKVAEDNQGTNFNGWIRQFSGAVNVKWFGDNVQNALSTGKAVILEEKEYLINTNLIATNSIVGSKAILKFTNAVSGVLLTKTGKGSISDLTIDAFEVADCTCAILCDMDYDISKEEYYENIKISGVTHSTNNATGILFYRSSSSVANAGFLSVSNIIVDGVSAGVAAVAKGIHVSWNNNAKETTLDIRNCRVYNVTPALEGDAIHITQGNGYLESYNTCSALIENCFVYTNVPMKRAFKIQYNNTIVRNCIVLAYNAPISVAFNAMSLGTVFESCVFKGYSSGGIAFGLEGDNCKILNSSIYTDTIDEMSIRIFNADNSLIDNLFVDFTGTFGSSNFFAIIKTFQSAANLRIQNSKLKSSSTSGCGIYLGGSSGATGDLHISNTNINSFNYGVRSNGNIGDIYINNAIIGTSGNISLGVENAGSSVLHINNSTLSSISSINNKVLINNSYVYTTNTALLAGENSIINSCYFENTLANNTGAGVYIGSKTKVSNCSFKNFNYAIDDRFKVGIQLLNNGDENCTNRKYTANSYIVDVGNYSY